MRHTVRRGIINHLGSPSVVPYIECIRHTTTNNSIFQTVNLERH